MPLDEKQLFDALQEYIKQPKVFALNLNRARELYTAVTLAKKLFPNEDIEIRDDPLQTGAMSIHVTAFDIVVRGVRETKQFSDMIALADNFEIYPAGDGKICFAAVFQGVKKMV